MSDELSLESLARRVEKLEQLLLRERPQKDWRRVVGIADGSETMRQIDEAGQAIRQADREAAEQ